jgi:ParB family chromosome partitioning protein
MTDLEATLVQENPADLLIGDNVRLDPRLDKTFIASIKERGVVMPIVAWRNDDGQLVVLYGKRRTLAAVEAGRVTVPVMIVAKPAEGDRLVDQVVENDQRAGLTKSERIAAYEQMALVGLSAGQIAKRTATGRGDVTAALTVAGSAAAKTAATRYETLTLAQAAVFAEFEGDDDAIRRLTERAKWGAGGGGFEHVAQQLRDSRKAKTLLDQAEAAHTATGGRVVKRPEYADPKCQALADLLTPDKGEVTAEAHADCPGHAVYFERDWGQQDIAYRPVPVCDNWPAHGHTSRLGASARGGMSREKSTEDVEADRAERRAVLAGNKAWRSAETVRRAWLREFAARPPIATQDSGTFMATCIAAGDQQFRDAMASHVFARELLSLPKADEPQPWGTPRAQPLLDAIDKANPSRKPMIGLLFTLAAYEQALDTMSWRRSDAGATRYLRFIEGHGYELSDIERRACGEKPDVDDTAGGE